MRDLLFERLFGSCCVRLGVSRQPTRRTEVTHDLMDGGFMRIDGWKFHTTRRTDVLYDQTGVMVDLLVLCIYIDIC